MSVIITHRDGGGRGSRHGRSTLIALSLTVVSALLALLLAVYGLQSAEAQTPPPSDEQRATAETLSGTFTTIFGDPKPGSDAQPEIEYLVDDGQGQPTELLLDRGDTRKFGGPQAFDGERVEVEGTRAPEEEDQVEVQTISFQRAADEREALAAAAAGEPAGEALVSGSKPWVTIGCRFADSTNVTPRSKTYFNGLMGTMQPGMDSFWRQLSYNKINLTGSMVSVWHNLPRARAAYFNLPEDPKKINLDLLAQDCTAAADASVFYPNFQGINMMFNQELDGAAWGGSKPLTRDGQNKYYSTTWMPPWGYGNQQVLAQEMGHGFGLPHSSGPYTETYDSQWDPMSGGGDCSPRNATYGCLGDHTIAYQKDRMGWIPSSRKYVAASNSNQAITLERLGGPTTTSRYLMAQIPIQGSTTQFYTVEARRSASYDKLGSIPNEAVTIHKVNTTLPDRNAQVVDPDNNGNPNDAGAMWVPGETFTDVPNGISVQVTGGDTTGYYVRIQNGAVADVTAPTGTIKINAGAAATNKLTTNLTLSATDANGVARMRFHNDSGTWQPWVAYDATKPKSWTIRNAQGIRTVFVQYEDKKGNRSPETAIKDTIEYDTVSPLVSKSNPVSGAKGVDPTKSVYITFNDDMDAASLKNNIIIRKDYGSYNYSNPLSAAVTYYASSRTVVLNPVNNLSPGATYAVSVMGSTNGVMGGAKDSAGNVIDQYPSRPGTQGHYWRFTTAG